MKTQRPIIKMTAISKKYGRKSALDNTELTLQKGEILGLVGDNGAGKSTLLKILSGSISKDSGQITVDEKQYPKLTPNLSRSLGIEMVYQDLALCENMTLWENIFLGRYKYLRILGKRLPLLNKQKMRQQVQKSFDELGIEISNTDQSAKHLSGGQRQAVAICRSLMFQPKIMLLDEPTASIALKEQKKMLGLISKIRDQGTSIILISHDISQLLSVADRVLVLKSGTSIWCGDVSQIGPEELVNKMFVNSPTTAI